MNATPKSRWGRFFSSAIPGWLIGVLAISDWILFAIYKTDIVTSWPLGAWPGSEWEINKPAALFLSFLIICLLLLIGLLFVICSEAVKSKGVKGLQRVQNGLNRVQKPLLTLRTLLVWASIIGLVVLVWNNGLIARPRLFYLALIGLLVLSAAFSSAETAFTILQEDVTSVAEGKKSNPDAQTKIQVRQGRQNKPSKFFKFRYRHVDRNIGEAEFQTLLSFLLVVANLTNLGGMSLIGKSLTSGGSSNAFSLVISAVIVVIVGEIAAKFVARRLPVRTASATVLLIAPLKWLMGWYTSCLILPIKWLLDRKWIVDRAP